MVSGGPSRNTAGKDRRTLKALRGSHGPSLSCALEPMALKENAASMTLMEYFGSMALTENFACGTGSIASKPQILKESECRSKSKCAVEADPAHHEESIALKREFGKLRLFDQKMTSQMPTLKFKFKRQKECRSWASVKADPAHHEESAIALKRNFGKLRLFDENLSSQLPTLKLKLKKKKE